MTKGMAIANKMDRAKTFSDIEAAIAEVKSGGKVGHRRLLHGRHLRLGRRRPSAGSLGVVGLLRRRHPRASRICSRKSPRSCILARRTAISRSTACMDLAKQHPDVPVYTYPADHGFNCDERASYDAPSAKLAWERTMAHFAKHLG